MKYSLITCLLLCFGVASAQLSVQNNAYIFVNDQVLFVTDDVNLDDNDSKIYLRNDAQLVQGTGTTGNSGTGELSIYQNSDVNQFAYNLWCSPVGSTSASSANNPFRVNQIDDPLVATPLPIDSGDPTYTNSLNGTPNMTATTPSLVISRRWLYTFVTSDEYTEWNAINEVTDVAPGLGFTMKGMGDFGATVSQTYDFRGKPNNGTITNSIAAGQLTLIGNPYPSALDLADFLWDTDNTNLFDIDPPSANTTGVAYFWEQDPANSDSHLTADYVGGYATFTCTDPGLGAVVESSVRATYIFYLTDGTPITPDVPQMGLRDVRRYLQVGQGFMVEGAAGIPGGSLVYVKNSHRDYVKETDASSSDFFRSSHQNNEVATSQYDEHGNFIVPSDYKRFRVTVSFNELYSRELLANFHDTATDGFDYGLEAKRPNGLASDAYWTQNGEDYVIQANAFGVDLRMPLVIDIEEQQPLSLGIYDVQNFDEDQGIYLYDAAYDVYQNLKEQNYLINIDPGHYTDRFEIVFTPNQVLSTSDIEFRDLTIRQNNDLHQLSVINPNGSGIKSIEIFDMTGKRIYNALYDSILNRYELSTVDLSQGIYIVNVTSNTDTLKSEKIVVN
ncbi:MAG: T9SS type A sorting domain-containing protein [Bacteroidota bacterium]